MNTTQIIESTTMTLSKAKRESSIQNVTSDLNDFSSSTSSSTALIGYSSFSSTKRHRRSSRKNSKDIIAFTESNSNNNNNNNSSNGIKTLKHMNSNSRLLAYSRRMEEEDDEELGTPINIYREHQAHLEQDKKARIELDTQILKDDLYDPIPSTTPTTPTTPITPSASNIIIPSSHKQISKSTLPLQPLQTLLSSPSSLSSPLSPSSSSSLLLFSTALSSSPQTLSPLSSLPSPSISSGVDLSSFLPNKFLPFGNNDMNNNNNINNSFSNVTDMWGYYHYNDMFSNGILMDNVKGVCCS